MNVWQNHEEKTTSLQYRHKNFELSRYTEKHNDFILFLV